MPKTLLLADDSVVIQKLVGLSFANEDVELTTTDNGDDAIAKARELKPDLVLADVVMPGKNGYEVCEAIKADPGLQHVPVLLLTGTFEAFDENRARSAGSDGHITKPFEAQALVDRVTELLAKAPAEPPLATTAPNLDGPAVTRVAAVPPQNHNDESFDFFDSGADDLPPAAADPAESAVAPPPPLPASPSPLDQPAPSFEATPPMEPKQPAAATPPPLEKAPASPPTAGALPPLPGAGSEEPALMPDTAPASTPPIDDLAFDADDLTPPPDPAATTVHLNDEAEMPADDDLLLGGETGGWNDDLDIGSDPIRSPADDATQLSDDRFPDSQPPAAAPVDLDAAIADGAAAKPASPLMSEGDRSSDAIAFGDTPAAAKPDPMQTMLADDLFGDTAPPAPEAAAPPAPDLDLEPTAEPAAAVADDFEVSASDLEHSIPAMPPLAEDARPDAPFTPPAPQTRAEPEPVAAAPSLPEAPAPEDDFSVSDGLLAGAPPTDPEPVAEASPMAESPPVAASEALDVPPPTVPDLGPAFDSDMGSDRGPDLTPIMRERVHETLERVAWEAFADLSDTIVKQVVEKVEQVAWEVIPQMAEAAIKEEIRRMKGDNDE